MSVKFSKPLPSAREELLDQRRVSILRVPKGLEDKSARSLNPRPLSYEPGVVSLKDKMLKRPLTVLSFNSWDGGSDHIIGSEGYEQRNPAEPFFRERAINLTSIPRPHEELAGSGQMILGKRLSQLRDEKLFVPLYDKTQRTLSTKILDRPELIEHLRHEAAGGPAVISAYKSAERVREVADKLGITLIGANEGKDKYGHKDWAGIIFDRAGVRYPLQTETVKDVDGLSREIARLLPKLPDPSTVMIKHVDSTSGNGVAPLDVSSIPAEVRKNEAETAARVKQLLLDSKTLDVTAMPHPEFVTRFKDGVLAQEYIPFTLSPSGQRFIDEAHRSHYVSTGVQVLNDGKIYKGAMSGAPAELQKMLVTDTQKIGGVLAQLGVTGNFGVDFLAKPKTGGGWDLYACEINIRRLGTTHPVEMMTALFGGSFGKDGFFHTRDGRKLAYEITDSVGEEGLPEPQNYEKFVGLTSADAYDLAARHGMLANDRSSEGIWPNMTVLLREYGKSGALSYAPTLERANALLHDWKHVLADAAAQRRPPKPSTEAAPDTDPAVSVPAEHISSWLRDRHGDRSDFIRTAAYGPGGAFMVSAVNLQGKSVVRVHDRIGEERFSFDKTTQPVRSVAASTDKVAAGFADGGFKVWSATDGRELFSYAGKPEDGMVNTVSLSADGKRVAVALTDGRARVFDVASKQELGAAQVGGWARSASFTPDGKGLLVADENAGAKLFDLNDLSKPVAEFGSAGAQQALVSPDGKQVAVRFLDGSAEVHSLQDGKLIQRFKRDWPVVSLSWLEGTTPRLAFGLGDDTMRLWDADSRVEQRLTAGAKDPGAELRQQWLLGTAVGTPDGLRTITADGRTHRWTLWGKR